MLHARRQALVCTTALTMLLLALVPLHHALALLNVVFALISMDTEHEGYGEAETLVAALGLQYVAIRGTAGALCGGGQAAARTALAYGAWCAILQGWRMQARQGKALLHACTHATIAMGALALAPRS